MTVRVFLLSLCVLMASPGFSDTCPDPVNSSLQWGEIPKGWQLSPFSPNDVQPDDPTRFRKANILLAGFGQGVACTYEASYGYFTIWWQGRVRLPNCNDGYWARTNGGYVCSFSLDDCSYQVAVE